MLAAASLIGATVGESHSPSLRESALRTLDKGIQFFRTLSIQGGYVHLYDLNTGEKWGEGPTDDRTIEVQPPGTPTVGMAYLRAFTVTGTVYYREAAEDAARALILGQNELGGWEHTIQFDQPKRRLVSFDDNQTQSAIRFLMALDQASNLDSLPTAIQKALQMMIESQFDNGAWPHRYPEQQNYHDFATFNDGGINDCIAVMMDAHRYYGREEYLDSLRKAGGFLLLSQIPPPQPGWAQQYNQYLQPAWARSYEPPSVCTLVTLRNINTLLDLALYTKDRRYLEPIPDAVDWLQKVRLASGLWPRFVELGTNQPLYYDRGRIRVDSVSELQEERRTGYSYEMELGGEIAAAKEHFDRVRLAMKKDPSSAVPAVKPEDVDEALVRKVISQMDEQGRWVSLGQRYKLRTPGRIWDGQYTRSDRISSRTFVENVNILCAYLERHR